MKLRPLLCCSLLLSFAGIAAAAGTGCAGAASRSSGFEEPDAGTASAPTDAGTPSTHDDSGFTGLGDAESPTGTAEVYGHSGNTLYRLDPTTNAITPVGDFDGCSGIVDIALDEHSTLYATTQSALYTVDRVTAKCTHVANGSYPNSLSFVPKGTVDPNVEALVGYVGSQYVRIDTQTGVRTNLGLIGSGLQSSGDIVSVKGGGTYLTVKGNSCSDCIVEVDPATGALVRNLGSVKHADVFGLAFWGGKAYGFDNSGELFEVTFASTSVTTKAISIPNAPSDLQFWGAGSTTAAPLGPK